MRLLIALPVAILLSPLAWTGNGLSEQPDPSGVLQTDDGEIIPVCDPPTREEMMLPLPPHSPATGAPGVPKCRLPESGAQYETRVDLPLPGAVTAPITEEQCRVLGLKDEDCPPRWPAWMKREKGIPE